jgi:hypothetical protein
VDTLQDCICQAVIHTKVCSAAVIENEADDIAALYATVSSSFMVEQVGLPHLTTNELGEEWNSDSPQARLELLKERVSTLDRR